MKILISEFITGGGLSGEPLPLSLMKEGQMMLDAIVSDFSDQNNVEIKITLDPRCIIKNSSEKKIRSHVIKDNYLESFRSLCREVDAVLPIAPESDDVLETVSQIVLEEKALLLGSSPDVIKLTSSKAESAAYLAEHDIPVIETQTTNDAVFDSDMYEYPSGWIVKPDQGVGCEKVFFCETKKSMKSAISECEKAIVQPMLKGTPASLSMLCNKGESRVIGYNEQIIQWQENRLRFVGTKVNSLLDHKTQLDQLANSVSAVLPELRGYAGMDVIINDAQITVVEINPRLTTSYVGLRESIGTNLAGLILDIFKKDLLPELNSSGFKEILVSV